MLIEKMKVGKFKIRIKLDDCDFYKAEDIIPVSKEGDVIVCSFWHRTSPFGPVCPFISPEAAARYAKENGYEIAKLYRYEHSGVAYYIGDDPGYPFTCEWDAGIEGWVLYKRSVKRKRLDSIAECMTDWSNGEVYRYEIKRDGEEVDSCGGFIGLRYCKEAAAEEAKFHD